jgi:hypothetical protein
LKTEEFAMFNFGRRSLISAITLAATFAQPAAFASNAPADPCSLLPAAEVSKALGRAVGAPERSVAPRPYRNTAQGTDCLYRSKGGRGSLLFRVYFDSSPSESADLSKRLQAFFGPGTPVPGIGDEAYLDSKHALHERKGNVRFYLELNGMDTSTAAKEKLLTNLATGIGAGL